jgi:hypothetical protein
LGDILDCIRNDELLRFSKGLRAAGSWMNLDFIRNDFLRIQPQQERLVDIY